MKRFKIGELVTNEITGNNIYRVEGYYGDKHTICYNLAYEGTEFVGRNYLWTASLKLFKPIELGVKNHVEDKPIEHVEQLSLFDL